MEIKGTIKSVTFHSPQNGFTVLRLTDAETKKIVVVTGTFPELSTGECLQLEGEWGRHPKFGPQFKATHFEILAPSGSGDIEAYLGSGLFPGIGEKTAHAIVEAFGDETEDILDNHPEVFCEKKIKGLPASKRELFLARWQEARHSRDTMLFLYNHDITGSTAKKLWMKFGQGTIEKIKSDPYMLCEEVYGIGFLKADEIAMKLGLPKDSPTRLQEAILYTLQDASMSDGHVYLPKDQLIARTLKNLRIQPQEPTYSEFGDFIENDSDDTVERVFEQFESLCLNERIIRVNDDCFYPPLYNAEQRIADCIGAHLNTHHSESVGPEFANRELIDWERAHKFSFDPIQRDAITQALSKGVLIITGGPGTGKTTILKGILHLARKLGENILLAAPTGRAAKRMAECCGEKASTIHRLLEVDPISKKFSRNAINPLDCTLLIVDEFSMVDTWLAASLLEATPMKARIILVGDADQLPSVGPGNVLNDLLRSPRIPSVRLQHIFRQAGGNDIADKASKINQGITPSPLDGPNFHFIPFETPEECKAHLEQLIATGIKGKLDINLIEQMQVLVPMRKGPLGIFELNPFLQNLLNPGVPRHKIMGVEWSKGDRVMQIKNNYDKNVFNGDVGTIWQVDAINKKITVFYDDKTVTYEDDELEELTLAYACTIHKSQGSEYPAVIVVLDTSHYVMLQRNLIYTAITRAKGHVWILSAPGAFHQAVLTTKNARRYTRLTERLG